VWFGQSIHSGDREFRVPEHYPLEAVGCRVDEKGVRYIRVKGVRWFTNLDVPVRHEKLTLYRRYNADDYPFYDNYDAINVDKVSEIPYDYEGAMGVPITFIDKYNPEQFEVLGWTRGLNEFEIFPTKRYTNAKQIKPNGDETNGGKVNTGPNLLLKEKPQGNYYIADDVDGYLIQLYMRVIIRNKAPERKEK
jgi:hypothetical protein